MTCSSSIVLRQYTESQIHSTKDAPSRRAQFKQMSEGIINQQLAGGVCLFTSLLALFQLFDLHVSVCGVLIRTVCAAYLAYTCMPVHSRYASCDLLPIHPPSYADVKDEAACMHTSAADLMSVAQWLQHYKQLLLVTACTVTACNVHAASHVDLYRHCSRTSIGHHTQFASASKRSGGSGLGCHAAAAFALHVKIQAISLSFPTKVLRAVDDVQLQQ